MSCAVWRDLSLAAARRGGCGLGVGHDRFCGEGFCVNVGGGSPSHGHGLGRWDCDAAGRSGFGLEGGAPAAILGVTPALGNAGVGPADRRAVHVGVRVVLGGFATASSENDHPASEGALRATLDRPERCKACDGASACLGQRSSASWNGRASWSCRDEHHGGPHGDADRRSRRWRSSSAGWRRPPCRPFGRRARGSVGRRDRQP
jgi:hypothetical protein